MQQTLRLLDILSTFCLSGWLIFSISFKAYCTFLLFAFSVYSYVAFTKKVISFFRLFFCWFETFCELCFFPLLSRRLTLELHWPKWHQRCTDETQSQFSWSRSSLFAWNILNNRQIMISSFAHLLYPLGVQRQRLLLPYLFYKAFILCAQFCSYLCVCEFAGKIAFSAVGSSNWQKMKKKKMKMKKKRLGKVLLKEREAVARKSRVGGWRRTTGKMKWLTTTSARAADSCAQKSTPSLHILSHKHTYRHKHRQTLGRIGAVGHENRRHNVSSQQHQPGHQHQQQHQ